MPRIACRDAGLNCDWFFESDDAAMVLVEDLKHADEVHPDVMKEMAKKYKPWEIVMSLLRLMKR